MERESNNRTPIFRSARTIRIFGTDITVPYNVGRRRRRPHELIDFFESSRGARRFESGGASRMMEAEKSRAPPPPLRDFLGIGRHRQPAIPVVPPPPPYPPNIHHNHPNLDADNLRNQMARLLTRIRASRHAALGGCAEPAVVEAFAEHVEAMMETLEAARACAICRALRLSLN